MNAQAPARGATATTAGATISLSLDDALPILRAIAEGIEDTEQLRALRSLGCQYGQGFLFSRPLSAPDTRALLESWSPAEAVALVGGVA